MADKWYRNSFRRNLVDMHIPDWNKEFFAKFDSKKYIDMLKLADVDSAYVYANSCVGICNWPTKVGHMHEGLNGKDIINELTEGCRNAGINVIVYINIWSKWAYDKYPDWRCISPDGLGTAEYMWNQPGRYGVCCMNSPYNEYVIKLVTELCENYNFSGLWVDMILWRTMCTCKHCREKFKRETGLELPMTIDWENSTWIKYILKREEWVEKFFDSIINTAKAIKPDITVMCNSSYYPMRILGQSLKFSRKGEFIGGDFNTGRLEHSFECKLFSSVSLNKPFEFLGSVMEPSLNEHSILKTKERLQTLMFSCLMNNGRFGFIDAIDPSGTLNLIVYKRMRDVFNIEKRYEKYLENDVRFCCDVGIYTNMESIMDPKDNGVKLRDLWDETPHMKAAKGAALNLIERHIPFDVLTRYDLERLNEYKVIILPDTYAIDDDEIEAFTEYVKKGGNIYASGHTGLYDGKGGKSENGRLERLLGVKFVGETTEEITYMRPGDESEGILMYYNKEYPLTTNVSQMLIEAAEDTKVLVRLTLPIVHPKDTTKFASAITDPPGRHTDYPSVVLHEYGAGKVIYCASDIEILRKDDQIQAFINMLNVVNEKPFAFYSDAPRCVEITMYDQKQNSRYVINLLNCQEQLPNVPVYNAKVRLRLDRTPKQLISVPDETEVSYIIDGDFLEFTVQRLDIFAMYLLKY
jgi:Beta-galactosidase